MDVRGPEIKGQACLLQQGGQEGPALGQIRPDLRQQRAAHSAPRRHDAVDTRAQLRPGVDGVVLTWRGMSGTLLPQVWTDLPERRAFLSALLQKAGLPLDFWAPDIHLLRYRVTLFE